MSGSSGGLALTTSSQDVLTGVSGQEGSAYGLVFVNETGTARTATLGYYQQAAGVTTTVKVPVPANSLALYPKPLTLTPGDKITALADAGSALKLLWTYDTDDSSTPVASGFTVKGVYSSGATYAINDVVTFVSATPSKTGAYVSLSAANSAHTPDTSTANWLQLTMPPGAAGAATDVWSGSDNILYLTALALWNAAAPVAVTFAVTQTLNFAAGINFDLDVATANFTLANPTGLKPGQSGRIRIPQDSTGGRTISYGSFFKAAGGAQVLTTTPSAIDILYYFVRSTTEIEYTLSRAFA